MSVLSELEAVLSELNQHPEAEFSRAAAQRLGAVVRHLQAEAESVGEASPVVDVPSEVPSDE